MATPEGSDRYNDAVSSARHFKTYATLTPTDLLLEGGLACRVIEVMAADAGTIIVENLRGEQVTLPAATSDKAWLVQAVAIVGGTASNVVVSW